MDERRKRRQAILDKKNQLLDSINTKWNLEKVKETPVIIERDPWRDNKTIKAKKDKLEAQLRAEMRKLAKNRNCQYVRKLQYELLAMIKQNVKQEAILKLRRTFAYIVTPSDLIKENIKTSKEPMLDILLRDDGCVKIFFKSSFTLVNIEMVKSKRVRVLLDTFKIMFQYLKRQDESMLRDFLKIN